MNKINTQLRDMAITNGLCQKWQNDWKDDWSQNKMVERFFYGIDFYAKNRFVEMDFIVQNFGKDFLRKNGILVNDSYSLLNPKHSAIIGNSISNIRYGMWTVAECRVFDTSKVNITTKTRAFALIHLYDNAEIIAKAYDMSTIKIIIHSEHCKIISKEGNVNVMYETDD